MINVDQYYAFISYSHKDKKWGDWLHKALETYKVPAMLVGTMGRDGEVPKKLFPIFRDREELPGSSQLGDNINEALRKSRYLIVICSPNSAESLWVNQEIQTFKAMGRQDRILCLIVNGEPNATEKLQTDQPECFPEAVRFQINNQGELTAERTEPIAADARHGKDGKHNSLLKLVAGLIGVNFDALKQREKIRRRWRIVQASLALTLVVLSLIGVWYKGYIDVRAQLQQKQRQESLSLALKAQKTINEGHPDRGIKLALQALPQDLSSPDRPVVREALVALHRAFSQNNIMTILNGHNHPIQCLDFSPAGNRFLSADDSGEVILWDSYNWQQIKKWQFPHLKSSWFSEDGRSFIVYSGWRKHFAVSKFNAKNGDEKTVIIADAPYTPLTQQFAGARDLFSAVREVILDNDNLQRLYTIWSATTGKILLKDVPGDVIDFEGLVFFDNAQSVLIPDEKVTSGRIYSLKTGTLFTRLDLPDTNTGTLYKYTFNQDDSFIAARDNKEHPEIFVWNADSGKLLHRFEYQHRANDILFTKIGDLLVAGEDEANLISLAKLTEKVVGRMYYGKNLFMNQMKNLIATTYYSGHDVSLFSSDFDEHWSYDFKGNHASVITFSNETQELIAFGTNEGRIQIHKTNSYWKKQQLPVSSIILVEPNEAGEKVFIQDAGGQAFIFPNTSGEYPAVFPNLIDEDLFYEAKWLAAGRYLLTYNHSLSLSQESKTAVLQVRDGQTGKLLAEFNDVLLDRLDDLEISKDQKMIAIQRGNHGITSFHLQDSEVQHTTLSCISEQNDDYITSFSLHPNGTQLAVQMYQGNLTMYNLIDGSVLTSIQQEGDGGQVLFSQNGNFLISTAIDNIHLLDTQHGLKEIQSLKEIGLSPWDKVSFISDGALFLVEIGYDQVNIYDSQTWQEITIPGNIQETKVIKGSEWLLATNSNTTQLYNWLSKESFGPIECGGQSAENFRISSDGLLLAYSGGDEVCLIDIPSRGLLLNVKIPEYFNDLYFAVDTSALQVVSSKGTVYTVPIQPLNASLVDLARETSVNL